VPRAITPRFALNLNVVEWEILNKDASFDNLEPLKHNPHGLVFRGLGFEAPPSGSFLR
jgi:hypothetical protein